MRALLALVLPLAACSQQAAPQFAKVEIALPEDQTALPSGPNVDLASATCLACHSADMITNQPQMTAAQWTANVEKMVKVYKANIDDKDVAPVVAYLVAMQESARKSSPERGGGAPKA